MMKNFFRFGCLLLSGVALFGCGSSDETESQTIPTPAIDLSNLNTSNFDLSSFDLSSLSIPSVERPSVETPTIEQPQIERPARPTRPAAPAPATPGANESNGSTLDLPECLSANFSVFDADNPIEFTNDFSIGVTPEFMVTFLGDVLTSELTATQSGNHLVVTVGERGQLELLDYFSGAVPDSVIIEDISYPAALFFDILLAGGDPAELLTLLAFSEAGLTTDAIAENNAAVALIDEAMSSSNPADPTATDPTATDPEITTTLGAETIEPPLSDTLSLEEASAAFEAVNCALDFEVPAIEIPTLI